MEDRSPPRYGLISPRTAMRAAWVLIIAGLFMIYVLPWGGHWTLAGGITLLVGGGVGWRARQV